jgi:predicted GH43/DUF377 family glycosyl hydrolase
VIDAAGLAADGLVRRGTLELRADPSRVVTRLFLPGQETLPSGISRADAVISRVLAMTADAAADTLARTQSMFADRHPDLAGVFDDHFDLVAHRIDDRATATRTQRQLIGAYFTNEYSIQAAAFFNPSIVAHPDQTGLADGQLRFVMSARSVGEGHISSIEFRTGVLGADDEIVLDAPGRYAVTGRRGPAAMSAMYLRAALADLAGDPDVSHFMSLLPETFDSAQLEGALASVHRDRLTRSSSDQLMERIRWIAKCHYQVSFEPESSIAERVLSPMSPDESHGVEDARFVQFTEDDGQTSYYGTYTAFDGVIVAPRMLRTSDFQTFESRQLIGAAAQNKGMALFPRRVDGSFMALSRWDRESIGVARSVDGRTWGSAVTVQVPVQPWELIQLGNCGSPVETEAGWLVLTHGVGPMRTYGIGATLLDLQRPEEVIGVLEQPLLVPDAAEREGYVPNVVYSCGAVVHGDTLVMPYGCSDSAIRFAFLNLAQLLELLTAG